MSSTGVGEHPFRTTSVPASRIIGQLSAEELRHHLLALEKVTEAALAHLSVDDLLPELLERLRTALAADTATVLLNDETTDTLHVRASRGLEQEVEQLADGRVFTGRQAKSILLVDEIGDLQDAIRLAGELGGIVGDPHVIETTKPFSFRDFLETKFLGDVRSFAMPIA